MGERLGGVGVTAPFAEGFDPLGLASRADAGEFNKWREAELKHGRVAMLAVPGFFIAEDFHPLFPNLPGDEASIDAMQDTLETGRELPILAAFILGIAAFESLSFPNYEKPTSFTPWQAPAENFAGRSGAYKADATPGASFPRGPWTEDKLEPFEFIQKQNAELNNGRLAMILWSSLSPRNTSLAFPSKTLTSRRSAGNFESLSPSVLRGVHHPKKAQRKRKDDQREAGGGRVGLCIAVWCKKK